jgi:hypothetical protein
MGLYSDSLPPDRRVSDKLLFDKTDAMSAGNNNFDRNNDWVVVGMKSIGNRKWGLIDMGLGYMRRSDLLKQR